MAINFVVVPGWTSTTFWSIVSKYRFRKFSLHILPKHFRDPPTLIWHFPISYVLCIFQFSLSIPGGDKARRPVCLVPMEKKVPKANFFPPLERRGGKNAGEWRELSNVMVSPFSASSYRHSSKRELGIDGLHSAFPARTMPHRPLGTSQHRDRSGKSQPWFG